MSENTLKKEFRRKLRNTYCPYIEDKDIFTTSYQDGFERGFNTIITVVGAIHPCPFRAGMNGFSNPTTTKK